MQCSFCYFYDIIQFHSPKRIAAIEKWVYVCVHAHSHIIYVYTHDKDILSRNADCSLLRSPISAVLVSSPLTLSIQLTFSKQSQIIACIFLHLCKLKDCIFIHSCIIVQVYNKKQLQEKAIIDLQGNKTYERPETGKKSFALHTYCGRIAMCINLFQFTFKMSNRCSSNSSDFNFQSNRESCRIPPQIHVFFNNNM